MLSELRIQNLAIIHDLHLCFDRGLNVLTGETGAGKSIIVDAVSLLLGGRGDADLVRAGSDRALVEGVFVLGAQGREVLAPLLERDGLEGDEPGALLLGRELRREGRNICRVNGRSVTLKVLSGIGQHLVDIHGQTEHLSLMRVREHVDLLDRYGNLWEMRLRFGRMVKSLGAVRRELSELRRDERDLAQRMDLLRYQVDEIETARLVVGEDDELIQERTRLSNAEQLSELAEEGYVALYGGDEPQPSIIDLVQLATRALNGLARLDPSMASVSQTAEAIGYQLEDLGEQLRDYRDNIEFNPRRLDQVEQRLTLIHGLERKYGDSIEEVLSHCERARQELDTIEHGEERIAELVSEEDRWLREIGRLGIELSERRQEAGRQMAAGIESELQELSMARAEFCVDVAWRDEPGGAYVGERRLGFDRTGLDRVEFLIAPNVGEPLKPLVRIASGGETSRLMLALKTVLAQADHTPTLIFDEIDTGIGGRVGAVVGQKLWGLTVGSGNHSQQHQVLCVTHLPQLASYGDLHLHVEKTIDHDRTVTGVRRLEGRDREHEIAAMLGTVTTKTRASAREMLIASRRDKDE